MGKGWPKDNLAHTVHLSLSYMQQQYEENNCIYIYINGSSKRYIYINDQLSWMFIIIRDTYACRIFIFINIYHHSILDQQRPTTSLWHVTFKSIAYSLIACLLPHFPEWPVDRHSAGDCRDYIKGRGEETGSGLWLGSLPSVPLQGGHARHLQLSHSASSKVILVDLLTERSLFAANTVEPHFSGTLLIQPPCN